MQKCNKPERKKDFYFLGPGVVFATYTGKKIFVIPNLYNYFSIFNSLGGVFSKRYFMKGTALEIVPDSFLPKSIKNCRLPISYIWSIPGRLFEGVLLKST